MLIKRMLLSLSFAFCYTLAIAQTGIGTITPNPAAALEVAATNKGFLPPRIALTSADVWSLTGSPTDGMIIYNTTYSGTGPNVLVPGLYYWRGNQWTAVYQQMGPTYAGAATVACYLVGGATAPLTSGFINGQAYTGTITAPYTAANGGTYPGEVVTINGVTLTRPPGTLTSASGLISYSVTGTWTGTNGTYASYPLTLSGTTCSVTLPIPAAVYSAGTINCNGNGPATGSYQVGVPATAANTKTVLIGATTGGSYSVSTTPVNGVTFSGTGAVAGAPTQLITLTASGTPLAAGTFTHSVTIGGQTCTFPVTYAPSLTTDCSEVMQNTPSGTLVNGTSYGGTVIWTYTNGNGVTPIPAQTIGPINGLTLLSGAGTTASGAGSVMFILTGTYTGPTGGVVSFPINLGGTYCHAVYGDNIRNALNAGGCASCGAYDSASTNTWIQVSSAEYAQLQTRVTSATVAGATTLPSSINYAYSGFTGATNAATNVKVPASSYIVGFAVCNAYTGYPVTRVQPAVKFSTSLGSGYSNYGSYLPNESFGYIVPAHSYFVIKSPTTLTTILPSFLAYYDGGGPSPVDVNDVGYTSAMVANNSNTLAQASFHWFRIQAITTTLQQW